MSVIQHRFICRPSESTVSEDVGIEPRTAFKNCLISEEEIWEAGSIVSSFLGERGGGVGKDRTEIS